MARNLGVPYTNEKPFYFVSYNSEDEARVAEYAAELTKFNIPIWYDNGLKAGSEWEVEIAQKIDECQAVIMFLSKNIFLKENSYVHKEFELATEYSMKKVYVMMLDEVKKPEVPLRFRSWWTSVTGLQCINAYDYSCAGACVKKLASDMGLPESGGVRAVDGLDDDIKKVPAKDGKNDCVQQDIPIVIELKKNVWASQPADIYIDDEFLGTLRCGNFINYTLLADKARGEIKLRVAMLYAFKKSISLYASLKLNKKQPKRITAFQNFNTNRPDIKVKGFDIISVAHSQAEKYESPKE